MSLLQTLKNDQLAARKAKNQSVATLLTTLIGEAAMVGKNSGNRETSDEEVIQTIRKFIKNINDTLPHLTLGSSSYTASMKELTVLESYLPKQLTDDELLTAIKLTLSEQETPNIGSVMKSLQTRYNGMYDGKKASSLIKELLTK